MSRNRRDWWVPEALRLDAEGRSSREIAEIIAKTAKPGRKPPSKTNVHAKIRAAKGLAPVPSAVTPAAAAGPPPEPVPLDETPLEPEGLTGLLTGLLRQQTAQSQLFTAQGDQQGAQRAARTAASIATQLAKLRAQDADDGDTIRVTAAEMAAAAARAAEGLARLAERVVEERARWPRCPTCGLPVGQHAPGEKSALRALVERVFGRAL